MAMPQVDRVWTRDEVLALPSDGNRYELIAGQLLVSPRPRAVHQLALYDPYPQNPVVRDWTEFDVPLLVAEVLSPSTARYDRIIKRRRYQDAGVDTYWIVDLDACVVEVWRPGTEQPVIADRMLEWRPNASVPPLVIELEHYFRSEWRNVGGA
jgi:Putative restriction endonuclease